MAFPCEIKPQVRQPAVAVRFHAPVQDLAQHFQHAYGLVGQYVAEMGVEADCRVYAAYHNMDMQNLDVEAGFTLKAPLPGKGEVQPSMVVAGTFAICHYVGAYADMGPAWEQLTQFALEQGYTLDMTMPSYEWYLDGPEVAAPRTDLAMPLLPIEETAAP